MIILRTTRAITVALTGLALCGCNVSAPLPGDVASQPPRAAATTTATPPEADPSIHTSTGAGAMDKTCEGVTFRIAPVGGDSNAATETSLSVIDQAGNSKAIEKPEEMQDYTAVGLGCAVAKTDGKAYFVVEFGELPSGCQFCEWFYLYDTHGNALTRSAPPLLVDESRPEGQQQSPNTREYQQALEKLGIQHPEVSYLK